MAIRTKEIADGVFWASFAFANVYVPMEKERR